MKKLLNENYNLISNFFVSVWICTIDLFTSEINKILADKRTFAFSIVEICTMFLSDITIYYSALKWHFWYLYILYHLEITLVFSCTFVHFCFSTKTRCVSYTQLISNDQIPTYAFKYNNVTSTQSYSVQKGSIILRKAVTFLEVYRLYIPLHPCKIKSLNALFYFIFQTCATS